MSSGPDPGHGSTERIAVVTGSASGIGAATVDHLHDHGWRVIGVDQSDADVVTDLATPAGRERLVDEVRALAPTGIDGIVANAGVNRADSTTVKVNYFGAVATLEGLRPHLRGPAPRAVLVASRAVVQPVDDAIVDACLAHDEDGAVVLADARRDPVIYASSKRAVARWLRQVAPSEEWAGAGIPLNAVAPGAVATPMIAHRSPEEQDRLLVQRPMPLGGVATPEEVAVAIGWFLSATNTKVAGQLLFVDGGGEALLRPEDPWAGRAIPGPSDALDLTGREVLQTRG